MIGSNQVEPQSSSLQANYENVHTGLLLEVNDGLVPVGHAHAAIQPPEHKPASVTGCNATMSEPVMYHLLLGTWAMDVMTEQMVAFMHYLVFFALLWSCGLSACCFSLSQSLTHALI